MFETRRQTQRNLFPKAPYFCVFLFGTLCECLLNIDYESGHALVSLVRSFEVLAKLEHSRSLCMHG